MSKIDFIGNSKKFFIFSAVLIAAILIVALVMPPQLDIQFKGGAIVTYSYEGDLDTESFRALVQDKTTQNVSFQESTDVASGTPTIVVSMPGSQTLNSEQMAALTQSVQTGFSENNIKLFSSNNVDAAMGREFLAKSLTAVAVASILLIVFIAFRFRKIGGFSAGVMAVVALVHDIIIVFGVFTIFRIPINDNFIAVVLTILGYSINDTIVVYDRVRENKRLMGGKTSVGELVNTSIRQSFRRSCNTSITTILAMVVVSLVAVVYNVSSIISFSFPMILGLVSGTYSSLCLAGPLWVKWQEHKIAKG